MIATITRAIGATIAIAPTFAVAKARARAIQKFVT
jgi:hypothetical protein